MPGRNWGNLFRIYLTLNNADSYAMLSELDGDEGAFGEIYRRVLERMLLSYA